MTIEINQIPFDTLQRLNARQAVVLASDELGDRVQVTTRLHPDDLRDDGALAALAACRRQEGVHAITLTVLRLDRELIEEATSFLAHRDRVAGELEALLRREQDVFVVYVITHYNPRQRPLGPLTINIGGDCYRTEMKDLQAILERTRDLAEAMLRKSVMIFPDIPALHGGKKGEWIVLDREGNKIDGLSDDAVIALGSAVIPKGIRFLNLYKEQQARELGICDAFPAHNFIRPDSGSPDVLSGAYWRGERTDKQINLCEAWARRGQDMTQFTCLPPQLGGTVDSSARPTGYGVATTAVELARRYFAPRGKALAELRFLLEAAGNVGHNTVESLTTLHGVPPGNVTVFDYSPAACRSISERHGVATVVLNHRDFYEMRLPAEVREGRRFDVWVNNGEGSNTTPAHVRNLLAAGVRVFAGGANNFLQVTTEGESLREIFAAGGWVWPDAATSGGGWTLAVIDVLTRCQGRQASANGTREQILEIITSRNRQLVADVLDALPENPTGEEVWNKVDELIDERVRKTLDLELTPRQVFALADTTRWQLA